MRTNPKISTTDHTLITHPIDGIPVGKKSCNRVAGSCVLREETMKTINGLWVGFVLASALCAYSETEDHLQKTFAASPGGKLIVDVNVGSIDVTASDRK